MHDWLKEYNMADVELFIEAVDKTRHQYFPDKLDMTKRRCEHTWHIAELCSE